MMTRRSGPGARAVRCLGIALAGGAWLAATVGLPAAAAAQEAPSTGGYPVRAIRTDTHLYIRNYEPDRWPSGSPTGSTKGWDFADCDDGPTKRYLIERQNDPDVRPFFDLAFAKRPAEELYDLAADPDQLVNIAAEPAHADAKAALARRLAEGLAATADPRAAGRGAELEAHPYLEDTARPRPPKKANPATAP